MQSDDAAQHKGNGVTNLLKALSHPNTRRKNQELAAENASLKKLQDMNAVLLRHVAEKSALQKQAAVNAALAAVHVALKRQLFAENATLKKQKASNDLHLDQIRGDCVNMLTSVNISKARERDLKKEMEDLKTKMNEKVQENISLTTELQLHQLESEKVEFDLKVKCSDLQEKLKSSLRNEERSQQEKVYLVEWLERRKIRISDLEKDKQSLLLQIPKPQIHESRTFTKYLNNVNAIKAKQAKLEREKKDKKDAEKQEKKKQLERQKKEKMESEERKRREKKEKLELLAIEQKEKKEKREMEKQEKKRQLEIEKKEGPKSEEVKKREKMEKIELLAREQKEKKESIEMKKQEKKKQLEREKMEKMESEERKKREKKEKIEQLAREQQEKKEKIEMKKEEKKKQLEREKMEKLETEKKEKAESEELKKSEKKEKEEMGIRRGREWFPCFLFEIRS
ncbi:DNA ligase 1-like [Platichthys flesus]|uniref:DNA ligase 1-like n=1 Tax=Platichthys flesus TaxID=8260 RepID=UPI002DB85E83|nr:DNA ligase 1-like [Platichthys flesus]